MMRNAAAFMRESNRLRVLIRKRIEGGFVLIVDDSEEIFLFLREVLKRHGFESLNTKTVDDTQTVLHEHGDKVICAIVDLNLAGEDGTEVIRNIERDTPKVPYVVFTGFKERALYVAKHFPRANVILKGSDTKNFLRAIGATDE